MREEREREREGTEERVPRLRAGTDRQQGTAAAPGSRRISLHCEFSNISHLILPPKKPEQSRSTSSQISVKKNGRPRAAGAESQAGRAG